MPRLIATTRVCLIDEMTAAKETTASDLRRLIASYDQSLDSPMIDLGDKTALRAMRDELKSQLEELERSGTT